MKHLSEDQLVLHYYGEAVSEEQVQEHLGACESCRASYQTLQRVLNSVDSFPVPERPADYEALVWRSVEARLPRGRRVSRWLAWRPLAIAMSIAMSMAVLVVGAFLAGRSSKKPAPVQVAGGDSQVRERVLLVAVGDHLERSQMVLVELSNAGAPAKGHLDISFEQREAEDLLESNRLYRQTAANTGDVATATLLDELERVLLDIAHSPSAVSADQLEDLRKQIENRGILFKVKVFGEQVERREAGKSPSL